MNTVGESAAMGAAGVIIWDRFLTTKTQVLVHPSMRESQSYIFSFFKHNTYTIPTIISENNFKINLLPLVTIYISICLVHYSSCILY